MMSGRKSLTLETSNMGTEVNTALTTPTQLSSDSETVEQPGKESKDSPKLTRSSRGKTTSTSSAPSIIVELINSPSSCSTETPTNFDDSLVIDGTSSSPITLKSNSANVSFTGSKDAKEIKCSTPTMEVKTRGSSRSKATINESSSPITVVKTDENETDNSSGVKIKIQLEKNSDKLIEKVEGTDVVTKVTSSPLRRTSRKRLSVTEKTQQKPTIVTRKSAAMDLAATTRSTRASRNSVEPTKGITRRATRKQILVSTAVTEPATKRKRTDSLRSDDREERDIKVIKLELPDESEKLQGDEYPGLKEDDNSSQETVSEAAFNEFDILLKLEPIDMDDDCEQGLIDTSSYQEVSENSLKFEQGTILATDDIKPCDKPEIAQQEASVIKRPRRRKINKTYALPSTYATRRRNEIALKKTKGIASSATTKKRNYTKRVVKSIDDIKASEIVDSKEDSESSLVKEQIANVDINENASENVKNCVEEPLTVETSILTVALEEPEPCSSNTLNTDSEKAASLSPELISEGVSEISVKQFYKKPEFLENNLGIEEDPKLGEIMQNVEKNIENIENNIIAIDKNPIVTDDIENGIADCTNVDGDNIPPLVKKIYKEDSKLIKEDDVVNNGDLPHEIKEDINDVEINEDSEDTILKIDLDKDELEPMEIEPATDEDKENCDNLLDREVKIKDIEELKEPTSDVAEKLDNDQNTDSQIDFQMAVVCPEVAKDNCKKIEIKIAVDNTIKTYEDPEIKITQTEETKMFEKSQELSDDNNMVDNQKIDVEEESNGSEAIVSSLVENDETLREKEKHLKTLGLLSLKAAAVQAEQDKTKRRKIERTFQNALNNANKKIAGSTIGTSGIKLSNEYTGTLKTVIKLNRKNDSLQPGTSGENKRNSANGCSNTSNNGGRQSLKITFQKGRARGLNIDKDNQAANSPEDTYYTIQNENEAEYQIIADSANNSESNDTVASSSNTKKDDKQAILIPEKASSFSIHPERLCQDQCYYCGGKFGLYDTPCHVAQIKSAEKQQKILENEEKLLVDNCLCDACFRHVDRRANAPSYKKRLSAPGSLETVVDNITKNSSELNDIEMASVNKLPNSFASNNQAIVCFIPECSNPAAHSLRRKCIRKTVKKLFFNFDMSSLGSLVQVCEKHYEAVLQYLGCALCKRRLGKNQIFYITADTAQVEKLLAEQGLPVQLQYNNSFCKLCRYYINLLLQQPQNSKEAKQLFIKNYRRRLLQFFNIQVDDSELDGNEEDDDNLLKDNNVTISKRQKKTHDNSLGRTIASNTHKTTSSPGSSNSSSIEHIIENTQHRNTTSNRMMLENDVMVDYDVPIISDSSSDSPSPPTSLARSKLQMILQQSNSNKEDISLVLRSNPNISMRELFPGEEDLGLQINVPFGSSSSQKTPEGWTRVQTFLQYDEPTRQLWEDLQKPYGNQSSFLRHLILLEKYYRNGDLVLSPNANSNAIVYTNTVQNRLQSFDNLNREESTSTRNGVNSKQTSALSRSNSVEKLHKQLLNNSVTITTRPKESSTKPTAASTAVTASTSKSTSASVPSRSILKTNLMTNKNAIEIVPITAINSNHNNNVNNSNNNNNSENNVTNISKQQKLLDAANKLIGNSTTTQNAVKAVSNINANMASGNSSNANMPPELISLNRRQATSVSIQHKQRSQTTPKASSSRSGTGPLDVIVLADTLSPQERLQSKHWRPTLMPVTSASHLNHQGPLFQTADGRRLPAMVQVQSGKRPFLISVHDYNRMCILRREKLLRDQMLKAGKSRSSSTHTSNNNLNSNNHSQARGGNSHNQMHINPNHGQGSHKKSMPSSGQLNSRRQSATFVPIAPKPPPYNHSASLLKPNSSTNSQAPNHLTTYFPKNSSQVPLFQNLVSSTATSGAGGLAISSVASLSPWMWNKTSETNQMHNGILSQNSLPSSTLTSTNISNQHTSSNVSSILKRNLPSSTQTTTTIVSGTVSTPLHLDTNLLSKIPKSLTVIPQHKMMAITTTQFNNNPDSNNLIEDLTNS